MLKEHQSISLRNPISYDTGMRYRTTGTPICVMRGEIVADYTTHLINPVAFIVGYEPDKTPILGWLGEKAFASLCAQAGEGAIKAKLKGIDKNGDAEYVYYFADPKRYESENDLIDESLHPKGQ